MNILAIGNSFSEDATHYLHQIAEADGKNLRVVNLFIGGCELKRHWENMVSGAKDYRLELNGAPTGEYVSIQEALEREDWDFIITHQASHDSGKIETYEPYLTKICQALRREKPRAEIVLHETWAYETDSMLPRFGDYHWDQKEMYRLLSAAYRSEAARHALRLIPSGDIIQHLRGQEPFLYGHGGMSLCRDGFHMNLIYGRYLLAAVWYRFLTGSGVTANRYVPRTPIAPNAVCDEKVLSIIRETVDAWPM